MNRQSEPPHVGCYQKRTAAFSLIEILVTVALLTVIILGLVAMFNQTRKAFTSSFTQVDVLESGRSAADILAREMEQMAPFGSSNSVNFYVDAPQLLNGNQLLIQPLSDQYPLDIRVNLIEEVFYLTRYNQQWTAVGYRVNATTNGIGSLYRYTTSVNSWQQVSNALSFFLYNPSYSSVDGFSRLIDGVVDFRIHAFDSNGVPYGDITNTAGNLMPWGITGRVLNSRAPTSSGNFTNVSYTATAIPYTPNVSPNYPPLSTTNDFYYSFTSNSVPAYVELELGVLEDRTLARYNALVLTNYSLPPGGVAAWAYLTNHAGQVHLFRQRIPIRNVNPAAYQ